LFWAAAELSVPVRLASYGIFIELQPVVRLPLIAGSFAFKNPDRQEVYKIPRIALALNLAIGLTF
jgi:hypothetical protein